MAYKDPEDQKRYMKQHYEANKELYKSRARAYNKAMRIATRDFLRAAKDKPCQDCGVTYPYYVMQFDHLDPATKTCDVGSMTWSHRSVKAIQAEIDKCELVCANCHAERTHQRRLNSGGQI